MSREKAILPTYPNKDFSYINDAYYKISHPRESINNNNMRTDSLTRSKRNDSTNSLKSLQERNCNTNNGGLLKESNDPKKHMKVHYDELTLPRPESRNSRSIKTIMNSDQNQETGLKNCNNILDENEKEIQYTVYSIEEEKNLLIKEFKNIGHKLRSLKQKEFFLNNKGKENFSGVQNQAIVQEYIGNIDQLNDNNNNKHFTHKSEGKSICPDHTNSVSQVKTGLQQRLKSIEDLEILLVQDRIKKNENILKNKKNENILECIRRKTFDKDDETSGRRDRNSYNKNEYIKPIEDLEKEKAEFYKFVMNKEKKFKKEEQMIIEAKKGISEILTEIENREKEIEERRKNLENCENEFEKITKKLEQQSEELMNQKHEYNKKAENLTRAIEKLQNEREEFIQYEKEFQRKNFELKLEKDKLNEYIIHLKQEEKEIQRRNEEFELKIKEILERELKVEKRENDCLEKEKNVNNLYEDLKKELLDFQKEKESLIDTITQAELKINQREKELDERENKLNERRETYDDFDLKLLGMKMNEELWQKKRDFEIDNLMEEVRKLKEKERELNKREEKLNKQEDEIKKLRENFLAAKSLNNNIQHISIESNLINEESSKTNIKDKTLCPLPARHQHQLSDDNGILSIF